MKRNFSVLMFLVASILGSLAGAQNPDMAPILQEFHQSAQAIPENLIQRGYHQIGDLNLKDLLKKFDQVKIQSSPVVETSEKSGQIRSFARWEVTASGVTVTLSEQYWNKTEIPWREPLALHELLGAAGFDDHNYNLSSSLWMLTQERTYKYLKKNEIEHIQKSTAVQAIKREGGIIGVGGGGDLVGPGLKISMLEAALEKYEENPSEENRLQILMSYQIIQLVNVEAKWKKQP